MNNSISSYAPLTQADTSGYSAQEAGTTQSLEAKSSPHALFDGIPGLQNRESTPGSGTHPIRRSSSIIGAPRANPAMVHNIPAAFDSGNTGKVSITKERPMATDDLSKLFPRRNLGKVKSLIRKMHCTAEEAILFLGVKDQAEINIIKEFSEKMTNSVTDAAGLPSEEGEEVSSTSNRQRASQPGTFKDWIEISDESRHSGAANIRALLASLAPDKQAPGSSSPDKFPAAYRDVHGFSIYGKNDREQIENLTSIHALPIDLIEKHMRPGAFSKAGFLGDNEKLVDVLLADDDTVNQAGLSHRQIASVLAYFDKVAMSSSQDGDQRVPNTVKFNDVELLVSLHTLERGFQESPFLPRCGAQPVTSSKWFTVGEGEGQIKVPNIASNRTIVVQNKKTGQEITFSAMLPGLIAAYGFYEGNTPYRVPPNSIVKLLSNNDPGADPYPPYELDAITKEAFDAQVKLETDLMSDPLSFGEDDSEEF